MSSSEISIPPQEEPESLSRAVALVRRELEKAAAAIRATGLPVPEVEGKLLRPIVAYVCVPPAMRSEVDERFWYGALSVQMVHEASLLHDDILDDATERRGASTLCAAQGIGPPLVLGDHYLTAAYVVATKTQSVDFVARFIQAVERTVAGEILQAKTAFSFPAEGVYEEVITGKSGELLGAAASLSAALFGPSEPDESAALGRRVGAFYQRIDDLLDYCTNTDTGKTPLQDYRQGKWTWILGESGIREFGLPERTVLSAIFARVGGQLAPAERAIKQLRESKSELLLDATRLGIEPHLLDRLLEGWIAIATRGVAAQLQAPLESGGNKRSPSDESVVFETARRVGGPDAWRAYFAEHAKTFSMAARLFPAEPARHVHGLYTYCRVTDDLVDDPIDGAPPEVVAPRLSLWRSLSRAAYDGQVTGIPVLDEVMGEASDAEVAWAYPQALLDGVGADLVKSRYEDWVELREYTFGVAGAVGGWMTQLMGLIDTDTLERAHSLGHAMQLTNILRDVGEDLGRDRVYLPRVLLEEHDLSIHDLRLIQGGRVSVPDSYKEAMEVLMARADAYYDHARPGLASLPAFFRRPAAAAAEAYRGIHDEVRRNGYDNLTKRARTSLGRKMILGGYGVARAARGRPHTTAIPGTRVS
jgi:phytoene synthase